MRVGASFLLLLLRLLPSPLPWSRPSSSVGSAAVAMWSKARSMAASMEEEEEDEEGKRKGGRRASTPRR